jgi:hypothetical protein
MKQTAPKEYLDISQISRHPDTGSPTPCPSIMNPSSFLQPMISGARGLGLQYWMMRLFLADRLAGTLFEEGPVSRRLSRENYLRKAFASEIRFSHRKRVHVYTPFPDAGDSILSGVVAREHTITIAKSPEEKYQKEDVPDWDTANVFIDVSDEADGQKVAMQDVTSVGSPLAIFRSLVDHINGADRGSDWLMAVNTITSDADFWKVMAENQGRITEIDFAFVAPNIWKGESETEKALKEFDKQYGAKETEIKFKNPDGKLNPGKAEDEGAISSAISFIKRGGGRYGAKYGKKTLFNSESHVIKNIPPEDKSIQDAE